MRFLRGDIVLAAAMTVAAISAASGLPPAEPMHAFLVLVVALVTASLAVRRLYPVTILAIVTAATVFFELVYGGYWPFAALLAIYTCAAHCPRRRSIVAQADADSIAVFPMRGAELAQAVKEPVDGFITVETEEESTDEEDDIVDLDEELHPDDVEEALDVVLRERTAKVGLEDEEEDEEEPDDRGEGGTRIVPRRENEFLCKSCFLVLPRHQLADEERMLCRDCA